MLRWSIYSRLAGYKDLNDAERLSQDPTSRLIASEKIRDFHAALPSRLHWFETRVLTQAENLSGLVAMCPETLAGAEWQDRSSRSVLDMDSTGIPVNSLSRSQVTGRTYNGRHTPLHVKWRFV